MIAVIISTIAICIAISSVILGMGKIAPIGTFGGDYASLITGCCFAIMLSAVLSHIFTLKTLVNGYATESKTSMKDGSIYEHYFSIKYEDRFYLVSRDIDGKMRFFVTDTRPESKFTRYRLNPTKMVDKKVEMRYNGEVHEPVIQTPEIKPQELPGPVTVK